MRLTEEQIDYRKLADYLPVISYICEYNEEATLLYASPQIKKTFGFEGLSFLDDRTLWQKILHPDDRDWVLAESSRTVERNDPFCCEYRTLASDGRVIWLHEEDSIVFDEDGEPIYTMGVMVDITEQKRYELELNQSRLATEHAVQDRDLFLSRVSHQLRTPLNSIVGAAELLKSSSLTPDQQDLVEMALERSDALDAVLTSLLELSESEEDRRQLSSGFDIGDALKDVIRLLSGEIAERPGVTVDYEVDSDVPKALIGDSSQIRQILMHLVRNALYATKHGSVMVNVSVDVTNYPAYKVIFSVSDTGSGADPAVVEEALASQIIATNPTKEKLIFGGSQIGHGHGLPISKQLIEAMGGELWFRSEPGSGSEFCFSVMAVTESGQHYPRICFTEPRHQPRSEAKQRPMKVLAVDDDPTSLAVIEAITRTFGHIVKGVPNASLALDELEGQRFDLVLMDIEMPGMNGLEATKLIRKQISERRQPWIVAATANDLEHDRKRCIAAGMDEHLSKPLRREDLEKIFTRFQVPRFSEF